MSVPCGSHVAGTSADTAPLPRAWAAVISGSGLAVVPGDLVVTDDIGYAELGWQVGAVAGHQGRLLVAGDVLLACGRAHSYEGFDEHQLEVPVRALAAAGVRRLVLTCACGSLRDDLGAGDGVVAHTVVDLRGASPGAVPPVTPVCTAGAAEETAAALGQDAAARSGVYVAVTGPQYETPAEAAWLAGMGDVVGMSAAPEVRAATDEGVAVRLLAVVANRAGASVGHEEVLAVAERVRRKLRRALARLLDPNLPWQA